MTWFMVNPLRSLVALKTFGLELNVKEESGDTQAPELYVNLYLKIGNLVNQIMVHMTVSICLMDDGIIMIATTRLFSFVSLSQNHLIMMNMAHRLTMVNQLIASYENNRFMGARTFCYFILPKTM